MHARIATYELVSGDFDDLAARTAAELGALLADKPGFVSYRIGLNAEGQIIVLNEWENKEQAETAIPAAASWVKDNIAANVKLITANVVDFTASYRA